jgi:hypothetical protein
MYNNFEYYGLFLKKYQLNLNMDKNKHYYQLICNNNEYINLFSEGCGNIPSNNYIRELNKCNIKSNEDCESLNIDNVPECIKLNNNYFKCIPGTPTDYQFKNINVSVLKNNNLNERKIKQNLEQDISNINPTNMPYYIWFNEKIFNNQLNIENSNNKSIK